MFVKRRINWIIGLLAALALVTVVSAQTSQQPIALGDNKTGQVSAADVAPAYVFNAGAGQSLNVLVLSLTPGFAPALRVVDPAGNTMQQQSNVEAANSVQALVTAAQPGAYLFIVQTANGVGGQFVISVQTAANLLPASVALPLDTSVVNSVDAASPERTFTFSAIPSQMLTLRVTSASLIGGPTVTLTDAATGEVLGSSGPRMTEASFRVPPGSQSYQVQISYGGTAAADSFSVVLDSGAGSANPALSPTPPQAPEPTATLVPTQASTQALVPLPVTGPCVVASQGAPLVNIRSGPGMSYAVMAQLTLLQVVVVTGRLADNTWLRVDVNGLTGWVSGSVVRFGGDCGSIPVVGLATPTVPPTMTETPLPTSTPTATLDLPVVQPTFQLKLTFAVIEPIQFVTASP